LGKYIDRLNQTDFLSNIAFTALSPLESKTKSRRDSYFVLETIFGYFGATLSKQKLQA
jgi:hypothetical protein